MKSIVNGGISSLDDRRALAGKAKTAVARLEGVVRSGKAAPWNNRPLLARAYMNSVDNDFGAGTQVSVAAFRQLRRLGLLDDIVCKATRDALDAPPAR